MKKKKKTEANNDRKGVKRFNRVERLTDFKIEKSICVAGTRTYFYTIMIIIIKASVNREDGHLLDHSAHQAYNTLT